MKYSEIKERLEFLKVNGFEREQWSRSYKKTLTRGRYQCRTYVSYCDIKQMGNFERFIGHILDKMDRDLETYAKRILN